MPAAYNTTERYRELENRLSECRGRINILEEKLLGSPVPLPVAEFDRLLDEYRAYHRNAGKQQKNKINY